MASPIAFFRNQFIPLDEAQVSIATHALNYGTGCFEGIRAYYNLVNHRLWVFRMAEHYERLKASCRILRMQLDYSVEQLCNLTVALLQQNAFSQDVYIRPLVFKADSVVKVSLDGIADAFGLFAVPMGDYLPTGGISVTISSWRRIDDNAAPSRAKITGAYINTALAVSDAHAAGFDDCIFLNHDGHVSEGSAANIFIVRQGRLCTPPITDNVLEGITRETVFTLAEDMGMPIVERHIDRTELYVADEVLLVGTGVQVVPVVSVDHRTVGNGAMGPVTRQLQATYFATVRGENARRQDWLTPV